MEDDQKPIKPVTKKHIVLSHMCLPIRPPVGMSLILFMMNDVYSLNDWPYWVIGFLWVAYFAVKNITLEWDLFHIWR